MAAEGGKNWNKEVGSVDSASDAKRSEFYKERADLKLGKAYDEVLRDLAVSKDFKQIDDLAAIDKKDFEVKSGDTLFKKLQEFFRSSFVDMSPDQVDKEVYLTLAYITQLNKSANVDFLDVGDKIIIEDGKLTVQDKNGTERFSGYMRPRATSPVTPTEPVAPAEPAPTEPAPAPSHTEVITQPPTPPEVAPATTPATPEATPPAPTAPAVETPPAPAPADTGTVDTVAAPAPSPAPNTAPSVSSGSSPQTPNHSEVTKSAPQPAAEPKNTVSEVAPYTFTDGQLKNIETKIQGKTPYMKDAPFGVIGSTLYFIERKWAGLSTSNYEVSIESDHEKALALATQLNARWKANHANADSTPTPPAGETAPVAPGAGVEAQPNTFNQQEVETFIKDTMKLREPVDLNNIKVATEKIHGVQVAGAEFKYRGVKVFVPNQMNASKDIYLSWPDNVDVFIPVRNAQVDSVLDLQ